MKDLSRLLRPNHIAVLGGSWAENVVTQCQRMNYSGDVWPVHPKRKQIAGVACFPSVDDLPEAPDATFIGVNRNLTISMVQKLSANDAGGAVCFASGFLEAAKEDGDAASLQKALLDAAGDMPILGPNCYGLINYLDGALLWPDEHGGQRVTSGVAIVTQSSDIVINMTMQRRGLPISYAVTTGNQAQCGWADIGAGLLRDERVTALGLHIEGFGDLRAFETLVETAGKLNKPIVALKVGRSTQAQSATVSHTASLAGSFAGANAFLDRLGIPRVDSITAFLETLKLLHVSGPLKGRRVTSMSSSGGEAALIADAAVERGVEFVPFSDKQRERIQETLGPLVHVANPLDYHTYIWNDLPAMKAMYAEVLSAKYDMTYLILDFPRGDRCNGKDWDSAMDAFIAAKEEVGGTAAIIAIVPENMSEAHAQHLITKGVIPFFGIEDALDATAAAATCGKVKNYEPVFLPHSKHGRTVVIDEARAKQTLAEYGIKTPQATIANNVVNVIIAAESIGYPVVLKGMGFDHKTEAGAVHLNLNDAQAVEQAAEIMATTDFLIESFINNVLVELLVGIVRDEAHGFLLTLAAGGVHAELLQDTSSILLPAKEEHFLTALSKLRIAPVLKGYRGKDPVNLDALVMTLLALQKYVADHQDQLEELEINPLLLRANDVVAADALIRLRDPS